MAEGLLRKLLAEARVGATVGSAGLLPGGAPATVEAVATMVNRRVDIRNHVSRSLDPDMARSTPLVIGMTRHHVREACATYGAPIDRTFTLKELVRRGDDVGPRLEGESVYAWLARINAGRRPADLMGDDPVPMHATVLPAGNELPDFSLLDHRGQAVDRSVFEGQWDAVFFGFTHCPDVCPTSLAVLAEAQQALRDHPRFGERGQVVFVSVDPERDSLEAIREYVRYFSPEFVGATASEAELRDLTRTLGALFAKVPQPGGEYTVDHSAGIFFVSPDLELLSVLTPPHTSAAVIRRFDAISEFFAAVLPG